MAPPVAAAATLSLPYVGVYDEKVLFCVAFVADVEAAAAVVEDEAAGVDDAAAVVDPVVPVVPAAPFCLACAL